MTRVRLSDYLTELLQLEAVACKDWLTNKVDRAVSGKIANQQTCGAIQLPLNNLGVTALDYQGRKRYRHFSWPCACGSLN